MTNKTKLSALCWMFLSTLVSLEVTANPSLEIDATPHPCLEQRTYSRPLNTHGTPADLQNFPHIVNLRYSNHTFFCAGALIDLDVVLTTALCIHGRFQGFGGSDPISSLLVFAGDALLDATEEHEQIQSASDIVMHKDFNATLFLNDIVLIRLQKPFNETEYTRPISLPSKERATNGNSGIIAGWGSSSQLKQVALPIMAGPLCDPEMSTDSGSQFCAGGPNEATCQGDPGSPFVCAGGNEICGIVSFGRGCLCWPIPPAVCTDVYFYIDWIEYHRKFGKGDDDTGDVDGSFAGSVVISKIVIILTFVTSFALNL